MYRRYRRATGEIIWRNRRNMRDKRDTVDRRNWRDRKDSSYRIEIGGACGQEE